MPSNLVLSVLGFTAVTSNSWSLSDWESCEYCAGLVWFHFLASPGIPFLVGRRWDVFLLGLVCVPC